MQAEFRPTWKLGLIRFRSNFSPVRRVFALPFFLFLLNCCWFSVSTFAHHSLLTPRAGSIFIIINKNPPPVRSVQWTANKAEIRHYRQKLWPCTQIFSKKLIVATQQKHKSQLITAIKWGNHKLILIKSIGQHFLKHTQHQHQHLNNTQLIIDLKLNNQRTTY